jgi:uncharacterized coiled-coil DUF342 family protein
VAEVTTDHLAKDVNTLHERTQETKASLNTHEAVCKERYEKILQNQDKTDKRIENLHKEIVDLKTMATQGKTSIRTLLWVGSLVAAVVAILAGLTNIFK